MKEIAISKFKATCLAVLEEVRKTGEPVRVTRFGRPVAEIVAPAPPEPSSDWLGSMAGLVEIVGDIERSAWTGEELEEMEAEWLGSWDRAEARGRENEARKLRLGGRRSRRPGRPSGR